MVRHAGADMGWLSTAAIFRRPSILRNLICPLSAGKLWTAAANPIGQSFGGTGHWSRWSSSV